MQKTLRDFFFISSCFRLFLVGLDFFYKREVYVLFFYFKSMAFGCWLFFLSLVAIYKYIYIYILSSSLYELGRRWWGSGLYMLVLSRWFNADDDDDDDALIAEGIYFVRRIGCMCIYKCLYFTIITVYYGYIIIVYLYGILSIEGIDGRMEYQKVHVVET